MWPIEVQCGSGVPSEGVCTVQKRREKSALYVSMYVSQLQQIENYRSVH